MEFELIQKKAFIRDYLIDGLDGSSVMCDIYNPYSETDKRSALVFVHGGGFVKGSKDQFLAAASWFAMVLDALCITIQYRTAPQDVFPAPIIDCLSVFEWIRENSQNCGVSLEKTFVIGGSPGANIGAVAMLADEHALSRFGVGLGDIFQPINGIFLNGIFNLTDFYFRNKDEQKNVRAYLNCREYEKEVWNMSSPVNYGKAEAKILMLHGSGDSIVPVSQCLEMKSKIEACKGNAQVRIFEGKQHAWFNEPENLFEVLEVIKAYIVGEEVVDNGT